MHRQPVVGTVATAFAVAVLGSLDSSVASMSAGDTVASVAVLSDHNASDPVAVVAAAVVLVVADAAAAAAVGAAAEGQVVEVGVC